MNKFANHTAFGFKLRKSSDDTYFLRQNVMDIVRLAGRMVSLPRIEVRIVENESHTTVCGYAHLNKCVIHIPSKDAVHRGDRLTHIVLHEIVHAVKGVGHDDSCYLMQTYLPRMYNRNKSFEFFKKYFA